LIPLTEQLNRLNTGYEEHTTKTKISHLLYVDDLKLIVKSEEELQRQIHTVKTFSHDINPLPVPFKSLLPGQEGWIFFSGHLNIRKSHYVLVHLGRQAAFNFTTF
jgi:hypothetical protein